MKIALSANHLKRYKEICLLLWKYGRSDLVQQMGADESMDGAEPKAAPGDIAPEQLADDLETMGPTYVKLGQVLASRPDLLPEPYLKALARLQDKVKPFSFEEVEQIVTSELGVKISKAFSSFDPKPLAAASLGQVHSAALRDGRPVVVKVQRPGIAKQIAEDFEVLAQIAEFFDEHTEFGRRYRFQATLEEMRITIQQELNYEREARNLVSVAKNLAEFDLIQVPQPVPDYSTRHVLTMDYVRGRKITSLGPLASMELEGAALAEELFRAYLKQVLVDGTFHADPHPGNVFITDDGRTAADFDAEEFRRRIRQLIALTQDQNLQQMNVGRTLLQVSRIAADNGLFVPSELTLLGKTLLQLDEVGRILDPEFDSSASVRRNVTQLMSQRMGKDMTQGSILSSLLEMKDFVTGLPSRVNKILDAIAKSELEVKVRALDAKLVMEALQKIANRITMGIILAALIIGASLLMRVETPFRLFGYPGLAMLLFLAAAGGGFWLLLSIHAQDRDSEKRAPR